MRALMLQFLQHQSPAIGSPAVGESGYKVQLADG